MAVKLDKEVLIKHHFWILAGAFLLMALIPLIVLGTSVSTTVAKKQEDLENKKKAIVGFGAVKNEKWIVAYKEQDKVIDAKKDQIWKESWETQQDLMTFPEKMAPLFASLFMGDDLDPKPAEASMGVGPRSKRAGYGDRERAAHRHCRMTSTAHPRRIHGGGRAAGPVEGQLATVALVGVVIMLLEPVVVFTKTEYVPSTILVLRDGSESMDLKDAYAVYKEEAHDLVRHPYDALGKAPGKAQ